jgi:hypothetical protein
MRSPRRRSHSGLLLSLPLLPVLLALVSVLAACTVAEMAVEPRLASEAEPLAVSGANPRRWNQALAFGPWATTANHDGTEFSWAVQAFGVGLASAQRPYAFLRQTPAGTTVETACHTRDLRLFRGSFDDDVLEADVTGAFTPALACALRPAGGGRPATLTLATKARDYRGHLDLADGTVLEVRSAHHFAGSPLRNPEPVGYELVAGGRTFAAVETVNPGRVWIAPEVRAAHRDDLAAASAALLLFGGD